MQNYEIVQHGRILVRLATLIVIVLSFAERFLEKMASDVIVITTATVSEPGAVAMGSALKLHTDRVATARRSDTAKR
jgi:hypothetical protein